MPNTPRSNEAAPFSESDNRRAHARRVCEIEVTLESESTFYNGFSENISAGGVFLATYDIAKMGEQVRIEFTLPGVAAPITTQGEVRWIREYNESQPDIPPGMGVRFRDLSAQDQHVIEQFVRLRDPIFYDDE